MSEKKRTPQDVQGFRPTGGLFVPYREQLKEQRFTVVPADIVLPIADRREIARIVFTRSGLERDLPHVSKTRLRADDNLSYRRTQGGVDLEEIPGNHSDPSRIRIQYKANHPDERDYKRLHALRTHKYEH